jgi:heme/copper-type cytochrome/quinol oxidase subunit 3
MSEPAVEIVDDVSALPYAAEGPASLIWWGTLGFMLLEGAGFVLAGGAYLYLAGQSHAWPPAGIAQPGLVPGTMFTFLALATLVPNLWLEKKTSRHDEPAVRWGVAGMTLAALLLCVVRVFEFQQLNVRWDHDAYGSVVWLLLVLHTTHLITDLGDTALLGLWFFTHQPDARQFSDVRDNAGYWTFVVVTWLPLYVLIYWGPRWL